MKHTFKSLCSQSGMVIAIAALALSFQTTTLRAQEMTSDTLQFQDRDIDLSSLYDAFPYSYFTLSHDGSKLFFQQSGKESRMKWIEVDGKWSPYDGQDAIDADMTKRNVWTPEFNTTDGMVYWFGDEHNEERFNIYRNDLHHPGKAVRITDVPYVYEYGFNKEMTKLAYVGRMGQNEQRRDELHILDLKTMEDRYIGDDTPEYRYTWGKVSFRPDGTGLILTALKDMDRRYCTMVYVDLATNKITPFNDPSLKASFTGCDIFEDWLSNDEAFYFSDQDGYRNLYAVNVKTMKTRQLTFYKLPLESARLVEVKGRKLIFGVISTPMETTMVLLDPATGKEVYRQKGDMNYTIGSVTGNKVRVVASNNVTIFKVQDLTVTPKKITARDVVTIPAKIQQELVQGTVERLSIPTFDTDPSTGKTRMLHAYLYKPRNPLPADKAVVMLESFYGGDNRYTLEYQIYNKAGIYVLSASPRGSSGFGRDFEGLNDGDLGGNEIIDIVKCAQYISEKLGIPAERVGCFGVSHGGFATMRLMTFPGEVNGHKESFPFGFGVETAGFCDILYQHTHSNIPDWTFLEAGDPKEKSEQIINRSPLFWADHITGPLLLCHGNSDNRVDIEGSRLMDRALTFLHKPHRYVEFPGMGHGIKGKEPQKRFYREVFHMLDLIEVGKSSELHN